LCHPGRGAKQVEKSSRLNLATQIVKVAYDSAYSSHASIRMAEFPSVPCPAGKQKFMTGHISMIFKSPASP